MGFPTCSGPRTHVPVAFRARGHRCRSTTSSVFARFLLHPTSRDCLGEPKLLAGSVLAWLPSSEQRMQAPAALRPDRVVPLPRELPFARGPGQGHLGLGWTTTSSNRTFTCGSLRLFRRPAARSVRRRSWSHGRTSGDRRGPRSSAGAGVLGVAANRRVYIRLRGALPTFHGTEVPCLARVSFRGVPLLSFFEPKLVSGMRADHSPVPGRRSARDLEHGGATLAHCDAQVLPRCRVSASNLAVLVGLECCAGGPEQAHGVNRLPFPDPAFERASLFRADGTGRLPRLPLGRCVSWAGRASLRFTPSRRERRGREDPFSLVGLETLRPACRTTWPSKSTRAAGTTGVVSVRGCSPRGIPASRPACLRFAPEDAGVEVGPGWDHQS